MKRDTAHSKADANSIDFLMTEDNQKVPLSEFVLLRTESPLDSGKTEGYHLRKRNDEEPSESPEVLLVRTEVSRPVSPTLLDQAGFKTLPSHLSVSPKDGENNIHFVISVLAGTKKAQEFFDAAVRPLVEVLNIKNYDIHTTTSEHTVSELTKYIFAPRANQHVEQTVILLSGDGGPVDMINALLSVSLTSDAVLPSVVLLPMGTGNALAHSSGLTQDMTFGLRKLVKGRPKALPMFRVELSPGSKLVTDEGRDRLPLEIPHYSTSHTPTLAGAVVCSWGLHAALVAESDTTEYRKYGADRFAMAAKELLSPADGSGSHRYQASITVFAEDGQGRQVKHEVERTEHMYVLLTLVSDLQRGFTISPNSKPLDGQLRFVHFGCIEPSEAMRIMGLAFQGGKHVEDPAVSYEDVDGVRLDFKESEERWRRVCVDGKIIAVEKGGWLEVHKIDSSCINLVS